MGKVSTALGGIPTFNIDGHPIMVRASDHNREYSELERQVERLQEEKSDLIAMGDSLRDSLKVHMTELVELQGSVRWRSYPEEKPERDGVYLVLVSNPHTKATMYSTEVFARDHWLAMNHAVVTNWLPIPPITTQGEGK